jgi:hypothetical protein
MLYFSTRPELQPAKRSRSGIIQSAYRIYIYVHIHHRESHARAVDSQTLRRGYCVVRPKNALDWPAWKFSAPCALTRSQRGTPCESICINVLVRFRNTNDCSQSTHGPFSPPSAGYFYLFCCVGSTHTCMWPLAPGATALSGLRVFVSVPKCTYIKSKCHF